MTELLTLAEQAVIERYKLLEVPHECGELRRFYDPRSTVYFRLIKGGEFLFGFDDLQLDFLKKNSELGYTHFSKFHQARPIQLASFFLSETPLLECHLVHASSSNFGNKNRSIVAYANNETFFGYMKIFGYDLPTEEQIEYMMKLGYPNLFAWGNTVDDFDLIDPWMVETKSGEYKKDRFGFSGHYYPSLTRSKYNYADIREEGAERGLVTKAGGTILWPWQWEEYVDCLPSYYSSSRELDDIVTARAALTVDQIS